MKKYSFNAAWVTFEKVVRILVTTLVGFFIARHFGPKNFGLLNYALACLAILGSLASLGLDNIVMREIVLHPNRTIATIATGIILKLAAAVLAVFGLGVAYASFGVGNEGFELALIAAFALMFQPFNVGEIFFQAKAESKKIVRIQVLQSLMSSAIKMVLIYTNAPIYIFVWSYVLDALILGAFICVVLYKELPCNQPKLIFDLGLAKKMVISAFPLLLSGMGTAVYMKMDLIILEGMTTPDVVGIYAAAAKLSESWYFLPVAICSAFTPLLIDLHKTDKPSFDREIKKLYSLMIWGSVAVGVTASIFGRDIISLVYGEAFSGASEILVVHIWSGVFVCIGLVNSASLLSNDRLYQNLMRNSAGAVLNVGLNFWWVPLFGALGAAYATLVAYAFTAWLSILFFKNGRHEFCLVFRSLIPFSKGFP